MAAFRFSRVATKRVSESPVSPAAGCRQAEAGRDPGAGAVRGRDHRAEASSALSEDQRQPEPVSDAAPGANGWQRSPDVAGVAQCGGLRLADRLCERGQPVAGARGWAAERNRLA